MQSVKTIGGKTANSRRAAINYYVEHVQEGQTSAANGSAPRWLGKAAPHSGRVTTDELTRLLTGLHPETGEPMYDRRLYSRTGGSPEASAVDLTFSAPKSVSTLYALADPDTAAAMEAAHDRAVEAAMRFEERHAARLRRGKGGSKLVKVKGLMAAAVTHHITRADDPQLHTHVITSLLAEGVDGKPASMLDTRLLHAASRLAGSVYQTELRHQLTQALGVEWKQSQNGTAEIVGVPEKLTKAFSTRTEQVNEELRRLGIKKGSAKARQIATLRTRERKTGKEAADLRSEWAATAASLGVDPEQLLNDVTGRSLDRRTDLDAVVGELTEEVLTDKSAHFGRRDVFYALADRLGADCSASDLINAADQLCQNDELVKLAEANRQGDWLTRSGGERWTTTEMLDAEQRVLAAVEQMRAHAGPRVGTHMMRQLVEAAKLNEAQEHAVRSICYDGSQAPVITGVAGSGKTHMMRAATEALRTEGRTVIGAATAGKAADGLMKEAGMDWGGTLRQLRIAIEKGSYTTKNDDGTKTHHDFQLGNSVTIVIDESAMTGTRDLLWVTEACAQSGAQLVLLGDPHQLQPVDAGGLAHDLDADVELTETVRANAKWERNAQLRLRADDPEAAWEEYRKHGRVEITTDRNEARSAVYHGWLEDRQAGRSATMIAFRRADVIALNDAARAERIRHGDLHPVAEVEVTTDDGTWRMCRGDEVMTTRPVEGLRNGASARVERVHNDGSVTLRTEGKTVTKTKVVRADNVPEGGVVVREHKNGLVTVRTETTEGRLTHIDAESVKDGAVALGYAITGHKAQGITVDAAHVLADYAADRQWSYVAMSRGRENNRMVFAGEPVEVTADDVAHLGADPTPDQVEQVRREVEWENFVSSISRDGAESSATSVLAKTLSTTLAERAEGIAAQSGSDPEAVAWSLHDRAEARRSAAARAEQRTAERDAVERRHAARSA